MTANEACCVCKGGINSVTKEYRRCGVVCDVNIMIVVGSNADSDSIDFPLVRVTDDKGKNYIRKINIFCKPQKKLSKKK